MSDTVHIRNISTYGPLDTPLLQHVDVVDLGVVVEVTPEDAAVLLAQFANWAPVDPGAIAITAACVAEQQQRHRDATGEPAPSDLKDAWVKFAQRLPEPDPDAATKTKTQLVADHGTQLEDPAEVAQQLAELGEQVADGQPPADADPPGGDPGAGGDDDQDDDKGAGDGGQNGAQS